jgi:hypothetical protein
VQAGLLSQEDADAVRERFAAGGSRIITPTLIAATGRRP